MSRGAFQSPESHLPLRSTQLPSCTLGPAAAAGDPCSRKSRDSSRLLGRVKLNLAVALVTHPGMGLSFAPTQ